MKEQDNFESLHKERLEYVTHNIYQLENLLYSARIHKKNQRKGSYSSTIVAKRCSKTKQWRLLRDKSKLDPGGGSVI